MAEIELSPPDIDDVDGTGPTFKRVVALIVVSITLFGSVIAYLQQRESNNEDTSAREAQRAAVAGLGDQVDASTEFQANYDIFVETELAQRRFVIATHRADTASGDDFERFELDAARFAQLRDTTLPLTRLSDDDYQVDGVTDPSVLEAELDAQPFKARLLQDVRADTTNDFGGKADSYVALLTVLAVALFLIGLSLTVERRARLFLTVPGVVIAIGCVGWSATIARADVTDVSDDAIDLVVEGRQLLDQDQLDEALDATTDAIEDSPDFAAAYAVRADVHFALGAEPTANGFVSFVSNEARDRAIADGERALELGANELRILIGHGFNLFLDGRFEESVDVTNRALDFNDKLAFVWFNLGVAEVARGNDDVASDAYERGMDLLRTDATFAGEVLSGARNDLSILRRLTDGRDDAVAAIEADLASLEAELNVPVDADGEPDEDWVDDVRDARVDGNVDDIDVERNPDDPTFIDVVFEADIDDRTPVSYIWYFRTDDDKPFEQLPFMKVFGRADDDAPVFLNDDEVFASASNGGCLPSGEYQVHVYAGDELLGVGETEVDSGRLGSVSSFSDEVEAFSVCLPDDWETGPLNPGDDGAPGSGGVLLSGSDNEVVVGIFSFPASPDQQADPLTAMDAALLISLPSEPEFIDDFEVGAFFTDGSFDFLPARAATVETPDGVFHVVASLTGDGVMRVVAIIASDEETVEQTQREVVASVAFERVGTG